MMHLKRIALPAGFAALAISQAAAQPAAPVPVARNGEKPVSYTHLTLPTT